MHAELQLLFLHSHLDCCNYFCLLMHDLNLRNNVTVFFFSRRWCFRWSCVSSLRGVCIQWNLHITSLRSKRFQSSYCAKVRAEAKKKVEGGGRGEKRKPPSPSPVIHFFFCFCPSFLDEPREETLATQATI